jgi:hypothetical protein
MKRLILSLVLRVVVAAWVGFFVMLAMQAWAGEYDSALDAYHQCLSNCKGTIMGRTHCVSKCVDLLPTAPIDRTGAQTDPCAKWNIPKSIVALEDREQFILEWAASGEICRIYGHWWKHIPLPMVWPSSSAEQRRCKFCGKVETKTEEWK